MSETYTPTWTSLSSHPFPAWLRDAKFGIYTHWGPCSVAGYGGNRRYLNGSWYGRHMYLQDGREYDYHCEHYGKPSPTFGYKNLIPLPWRFDDDGLQVELPKKVPSDIAVSLRIEMTA